MTEIRKIPVDAIPSDLDPNRNPIIATHFFGWQRLGDVAAGIIRDLRRRRNVDRLCREWPRAMVEIVDEFGAKSMRMTEIEQRLEHCVQLLDAGVVEAVGGDRLSPAPLHLVVNDDDLPPAPGEAA